MKRIVLYAAALSLLAAVPLYAQNADHRGANHDAAAPERGKSERPAPRQNRPNPSAPHSDQGQAPRNDMRGEQHPNMSRGPAVMPAPTRHAAPPQNQPAQPRAPGSHDGRPGQPTWSSEHSQNNGARPGNAMQARPPINDRMEHANRPDRGAFRRNMQAPQQFHGGNYRAPQGYRYRHWSYGETLPRGYYQRNYWIGNFMMYGLFAPPADLIWVRVGNDALLIDRDSGDIVQVRYGVFY